MSYTVNYHTLESKDIGHWQVEAAVVMDRFIWQSENNANGNQSIFDDCVFVLDEASQLVDLAYFDFQQCGDKKVFKLSSSVYAQEKIETYLKEIVRLKSWVTSAWDATAHYAFADTLDIIKQAESLMQDMLYIVRYP